MRILVQDTEEREQLLRSRGKAVCRGWEEAEVAFKVLIKKFKQLRKTKEQMIKYCMRKAFKSISERTSEQTNKGRGPKAIQLGSFLRNGSAEKTMNSAFLKRLFSDEGFLEEYREFIKLFPTLMAEDNEKKIKYLSKTIMSCL